MEEVTITRLTTSFQSCRRSIWLFVPALLAGSSHGVLAQTPIADALAATVIIEVDGPGGRSHGSGFVTSSDGTIVTAAHVIAGATSAIVRVAGFDLPTVELGNADHVSVGQRVIVIGAPIDPTLAGTVSDGLVAAFRMMDGTRHIQISAPTSPGNSGGPVMTEDGVVIGLVVSGINAQGAENLNFALPINYVRGQLSLAASKPLQGLAEVQETMVAENSGDSSGATFGDVNLDEGFVPDPHEISLVAGGSIEPDFGECNYGHVAEDPDVDFFYTTSGGSNLYVYVNADEDTTLLINKPDGSWVCDDDLLGNRNPVVVVTGAAGGLYNIWVRTFGSDTAPATLYISEIDPR